MTNDPKVPGIFRRYALDACDTLHFIALSQDEDSRTKIRACEALLRNLSECLQVVDVLDRIARIESELGITEDTEEEDE